MTATCPACTKPVLEVPVAGGATVRLDPGPRPGGAVEYQGRRYRPHKCSGRDGALDDVRRAQSVAAHQARTRRGRPRPQGPFRKAAGVRVPPPGGGR